MLAAADHWVNYVVKEIRGNKPFPVNYKKKINISFGHLNVLNEIHFSNLYEVFVVRCYIYHRKNLYDS